jgi:hypothetical protein
MCSSRPVAGACALAAAGSGFWWRRPCRAAGRGAGDEKAPVRWAARAGGSCGVAARGAACGRSRSVRACASPSNLHVPVRVPRRSPTQPTLGFNWRVALGGRVDLDRGT